MADKINNNFEDEEYIEDTENTAEYSDDTEYESDGEYQEHDDDEYESSDDAEYESSDDEYEEEDDNSAQKKKNNNNKLLILIILIAVVGLISLLAVGKFMSNKNSDNVVVHNETSGNFGNTGDENNGEDQNSDFSNDNLADSFFDAANGENNDMMSVDFNDNGDVNVSEGEGDDANVATVSEADSSENASSGDLFENQEELPIEENHENQENNAIMVVYNKAARINPFKPPVTNVDEKVPFEVINNTQFEIIEPPTTSVPDENLSRLLQTQISGILYDTESPSAIVNLNGIDQFVKVGDVISGYKIVRITNDKVQIDYKNNSYVASVGELFTRGSLEKQSAVVNLNNKFAGRYKNNN